MFELHGQTAIVTGGCQGIGLAIAERLAAAGAAVRMSVINDANTRDPPARLGNGCFPLRTDVSDDASIRETVTEARRRTGQIDILVNNAGIAGRAAPIEEQTNDDGAKVMAVNLSGV